MGDEHLGVDVLLELFDQVVHHSRLDRSSWSRIEIESKAEEDAELGRRSKIGAEIMAGHFRRAMQENRRVAGELERCTMAAGLGEFRDGTTGGV